LLCTAWIILGGILFWIDFLGDGISMIHDETESPKKVRVFYMLEFDAYQRSETVRRLLQSLLSESGSTILDVGGYPGRLRALMPQYQWVICDPLVDAPGDQVIGDAAALPFQKNAVDCAVSLDVLEHIKPDKRTAYIQEINRVSKQGFILSFPYQHPLVQQTEESVRLAYEEKYSGKMHPWLEEHHVYGLPNKDEVETLCQNLGLSVHILHVGAVERWQMLQLFGIMLEGSPEGIETAKEIDRFYQSQIYLHDFQDPSYRVVFICWKEDRTHQICHLFPKNHNDLQTGLKLQSYLHQQCSAFLQSQQHTTSSNNNHNNFDHHSVEYIKRLETGLRLWEDTCASLNQRLLEELQWRHTVESNVAMKFFKKIKRFIHR
jgi:SAM-dependent methyltransferase